MEEPKPKKPRKSRAIPGAKKGGSKPHGPEPLRAKLTCKATTAEHEAVRAAAEAAGLSESAWIRRAVQEVLSPSVRLEWHGSAEAVDLCLCLGNFSAPVLQAYPGQWAFAADGRFFGPSSEEVTKARLAEYVQSLGLPVQMPPMPEFGRADHARQIAAHLDAMGGMPSATS